MTRDQLVSAFFWGWRLLLTACAAACLVSIAAAVGVIHIKPDEAHPPLYRASQVGIAAFTLLQVVYYAYISRRFLQWRDRGLWLAGLAGVAAALSLVLPVKG